MRGKITEEDIILAHKESLFKLARPYCWALGFEDAQMESLLASLYAIRSYSAVYAKFKDYLEQTVIHHLNNERRLSNNVRRVDSQLSLNQQLVGQRFADYNHHLDGWLFCKDFLQSLEPLLRSILWALYCGYSEEEIIEKLHMTECRLDHIRKKIIILWQQYQNGGN